MMFAPTLVVVVTAVAAALPLLQTLPEEHVFPREGQDLQDPAALVHTAERELGVRTPLPPAFGLGRGFYSRGGGVPA